MKAADSVPVSSGWTRRDPAPLEAVNHILILNAPGLQSERVLVHRGWSENKPKCPPLKVAGHVLMETNGYITAQVLSFFVV